jgi:hypothetical protein
MAFIEFDSKNNSIKVIRGIVTPTTEFIEIDSKGNNYSIFKNQETKDFTGVKLNSYMSPLELKGYKAETVFKLMLEQNNVPFLYVGQGPLGIEKSNILKDKMNSKRPDFLVNLPDIGTLFFDVKCRQKKGFPNNKKTYFQLFDSEINTLINLHEQLLVPVWIAFVDESKFKNGIMQESQFFIVPISTIKKYYDRLKLNLDQKEIKMLTSIRIPDEFLFEINTSFNFKVGISIVDEELIKEFAMKYKGLIRKIEDQIKNCIRTKNVLKSNLTQTLINETGSFAFKNEVDKILQSLIEEKVVVYEPKKPLSLLGE